MDIDSELLAERLVDQTELLFRNGPQKQIGKHAQGECFVLRCLARSPKPLLPSDLSTMTQSSTARIAVVLNTLEKKGYITRAIDPADRRRVLVSLTSVGAEYVRSIRQQLRQHLACVEHIDVVQRGLQLLQFGVHRRDLLVLLY